MVLPKRSHPKQTPIRLRAPQVGPRFQIRLREKNKWLPAGRILISGENVQPQEPDAWEPGRPGKSTQPIGVDSW